MTGQQLKNSILQEAIEGRLAPQDPNDEPASVLLERIRAEKARLVKEKKIKKDKNESRIYRTEDGHWMEHFEDKSREDICIDEEIPFDVPSGWEWCRLKENVSIISGLSYKKENLEVSSDKYIRVLRGGNITYGNWCSKADDVMIAEKFVPQELILKSGTFISPAVTSLEHMGKTALVREDQDDIVVGGFVLMLIPFYKNNSYLEYLNSIFQTAYYKEKCQSITNKSGQAFYNLSRAKLLEVLIPLPPLAEQHRIVEKIESLLPKVEAYGKAQEELEKLNEALPEQLKRSILQEAIEGRLVPQDPNDEPASVLLERIRVEKARLVKEKKIKKDKNESRIYRTEDGHWMEHFEDKSREDICIDEEIPFDVPNSWEWVRLKNILNVCSARRVHEKDWRKTGIPFYRTREIGKLSDYGFVDNELYIDESLYKEFAKNGVPQCDDLMMTAVGTLGKVYIVKETDVFYYKDASVLCLSNIAKLNPKFLKYVIESSVFINQYSVESQGTTVGTLTMVRLNEYFIPLPPLAEQHRIVEKLEEILPKLNNLKKETEK